MLEKVIENWTSRLDYIRASRGSLMPEIIFKMLWSGVMPLQTYTFPEAGISFQCGTIQVDTNRHRLNRERYEAHIMAETLVPGPVVPCFSVPVSHAKTVNLWNHDGRIRLRRYAGERCFPKCVIERHSDLTPGVMVWGAISYHGRCNLLRIEGNPNSNRYSAVHGVLQLEVVLFLQGIPGAIFQQDNARPHVAKTVRDFCSVKHIQLLPMPTYLPDMLLFDYVWDLVGRCLTRDPRPAASKDKLLLCMQAIWNSFPQVDIQNLFDSMPRRIAALITARGS
ncbi:transposable element Tcb2 transposase [Trichonephila clavipes]|nr:transposable element Tcb2 transposase [Trichonephila clavipes]